MKKIPTALVKVYLRNSGGACYEYIIHGKTKAEVNTKAREHIGQIWANGYRHCGQKGPLEFFPPHWIDKIKVTGDVTSNYPDWPSGT